MDREGLPGASEFCGRRLVLLQASILQVRRPELSLQGFRELETYPVRLSWMLSTT